jgi:hypothetical protein
MARPMRTALYQLGEDFLSTIVFLTVYFVSGQSPSRSASGSFCFSSSAGAPRTSWGGSAW